MQLLDFFLLIWENRNDLGLFTIIIYMMPVSLVLTGIIRALEER